jgi:predicted Zn-ribbon and HTH transcriptional regulator
MDIAIKKIPKIERRTCLRCGESWYPRGLTDPVTCPKCRSPYWNIPRKEEIAE